MLPFESTVFDVETNSSFVFYRKIKTNPILTVMTTCLTPLRHMHHLEQQQAVLENQFHTTLEVTVNST